MFVFLLDTGAKLSVFYVSDATDDITSGEM